MARGSRDLRLQPECLPGAPEYQCAGELTGVTWWSGIVKNTLHAWNQGMPSLRDPRTPKRFMGLTTGIERAGFRDAAEPAKPARLDEPALLARK